MEIVLYNKRYTQCITIRLRRLITTEQTDTPDEHEIHVIHGFIVSSRMRFPPPRTMFVQICHEYNIVCKHTKVFHRSGRNKREQ